MGSIYYKEQETKNYSELIKYFSYEILDLKYILLDIDTCVRGLGGVKKTIQFENLPSIKMKHEDVKFNPEQEETEEQRLERHRKFFESLKGLVDNKKEKE